MIPNAVRMVAVANACWLMASLSGCGEAGPKRIHVFGDVTWKGQPVPAGYITLSPDVKQGNSGPQGVAWIQAGKFDTSFENGRGAAPGAQVAQVFGYDGINRSADHPWGAPLFVRYETTLTAQEPAAPVTLVVPDSTRSMPTN